MIVYILRMKCIDTEDLNTPPCFIEYVGESMNSSPLMNDI